MRSFASLVALSRVGLLRSRTLALLSSSAVLLVAAPSYGQQLPTGGTVTSGSAAISAPSGTSVLITQTSHNAIINWGSFSVGAGNSVRFDNGTGATLNRVTGFSPSQIDGALSASGSLYLVNPNGITVGPTGQVTTGGSFVASTHDVSDAEFNAGGAMTFKGASTASIINYGSIGSLGGDVALIARKVENAGTLTAPNGTVGLAAGYEVLVRDAALSDGKFVVKVGGGDTEAKTTGVIKAAEAELKANGGNVYALAGNTESLTKATGVASKGGRIFLTAGDGGSVQVTQKVSARAAASNGKAKGGEIRVSGGTVKVSSKLDATGEGDAGGTIVVTAHDIALAAGADLDASGTTGGLVLVGGDYQGGRDAGTKYLGEDVATATTTTVDAGATIRADGASGAGGKIVVWSNEKTAFSGAISATGAGSAAGGDAEVSGKAQLAYEGTADLRSESGTFGTLLLDPYNLTISNASSSGMSGFDANGNDSVLNVTTLTNALATANVAVTTGSGGSQAGNITVAAPISWSANTTLTLNAVGSVIINQDVTATGAGAGLAIIGTSYSLNSGARVTLSGSAASLAINGQSYTLIHDATALQSMGSSGFYALGNDIDASATAGWNSGAGFVPITGFTGTFAGLGHIVDSLTINRPSTSLQGLFGDTNNAVLRDVTLSNITVNGLARVGALVGNAQYSNLSNIHVTGSVSGYQEAGGIVGISLNSTLSGSSSAASVTSIFDSAGGLVGSSIYDSIISDSYAIGSVTAPSNAGGVVGLVSNGAPFTLSNVYASGKVSGTSGVGGLIGSASSTSVTLTNAYWDANSTGQATAIGTSSGSTITGTGIDVSGAPRTQATYTGLDFTNTWVMIDGETRPMLRSDYSTVIATPAALQLMSLNLAGNYTLGANIDMASAEAVGSNGYYGGLWGASGFVPVGTELPVSSRFTGTFNGQGHTISGLMINRGSSEEVGLFGYTFGATVTNVVLSGGSITGGAYVGPLIGTMDGGVVSSVSSSATASSPGVVHPTVGGLIGRVTGGTISDAFATGDVTAAGQYVGGLVGDLSGAATIIRSYATGNVTSTGAVGGYVGGLVGNAGTSSSISQSYATGTVTGADGPIGGFVGFNDGTITDSYATGRVNGAGVTYVGGFVGLNFTNGTITNAYSTGYVTGASGLGGFAGTNSGSSSAFTNVYWDTQTSGQSVGIGGGSGSATPRTTAQLQGSLPFGFSSSIWGTGTNLYPYFTWRYSTTPVAISGVAYSDAGTTELSGSTVTAVSGGNGIGSAVTGANGYYYILASGSSLAGTGVLTYLDNGTAKGAAFSDVAGINGVQNLSIYGTAARLTTGQSTLTATRTNYVATRGSYSDTDLSFLSSSSFAPLTTTAGYGVYLNTSGSYTLNTNLGSSGLLSIDSGGTFSVSGTITLAAAGALTVADAVSWSDASSLTLSTTNGGNISLAGAVTAPSGTLSISAAGTATSSAAVNVGTFRLTGGTWRQVAATLPAFAAGNFVLTGGTTFLRATGGDGSVVTPYQISDVYGLQGVGSSSLLSQNFLLTADVDASVTSGWNSGDGFSPIGTNSGNFVGSFDGGNHAISGLKVSTQVWAGLFGIIGTGGSVRNLSVAGDVSGVGAGVLAGYNSGTVTNVKTSGTATNALAPNIGFGFLGGLVGYQTSGTILDSSSSVTVVNSQSHVSSGGLVGASDGGTASISNSFATGAVSSSTTSDTTVGGLVGRSSSAISGSYATGAASGGGWTGGLVGLSTGSISNAFATGAVSGTSYVGGLVGQSTAAITNAYATGAVTGGTYSGGLVGYNGSAISNSYSTGAVTGGTFQGGFIGYQNAGTITASFWNTTTSGTFLGIGAGASSGVVGLTTAQMSSLSTFTGAGWSIDDAGGTSSVWRIYDGSTMPLLRSFMTGLTVTGGSGSKTYDGSATASNVGTLVYSPSAYTPSLVSGTASYTASSANAGSYSGAGLTLSGLYSSQLGYDITFVSGSLVVTQAALTVTASNDAKTYDGAAYSGGNGVTYSGFVGSDSAASLGGTLAYGGTAQGAVNAGSYSITASGLTSTNYAITYQAGTLTVATAALTVTANDAAKTYDGAAYSGGNGVTYSGFVGSDSATSLGGTLAYGGTAQGAVNAGTYGLTASGLTSGNYTISYVPGTLTVSPAALTVTANAATKTYDALAYSGGNGVTYGGFVGTDTAASLGGTLTYGGTSQGAVNVGSYSLTASGLTSSNYTISYVPGTLSVSPAALTVTANAATKVYDAAAYAGGNGVTYSGFVGSDSAASLGGTLVYGGTSQGAVNAGSYGITASGLTSGNYTISYIPGALTVSPAALTVAANAATKTYDATAYSGGNGVSYSGFAGSDSAASLGGTLVYGGSSQGAVNAGTYGITASGLTSGNYTISYVPGTLTVSPAALTVTANAATKVYDGTAYSGGNGVTYSGFAGSDSAASLGGALVYGGTSQGAVNAGSYAITASGLTSGNYAINYVPGRLTVSPAALAVAANAQTMRYGDAVPALTYAVTGGTLYGGDTLSGGLATAASSTAGVGTYAITQGTLGNANYAIAYTSANLAVTARPLTVTANAANMVYGDAVPTLTYAVGGAGLVNGDSLSGALATAASSATGVGTYAITQGTLAASTNYALTYVGGAMVISARALTVIATNQSRLFGAANPVFTYTVGGRGLVNGDGLTGALTSPADANSIAGAYPILQGSLAASANYALTYVPGTLTVVGAAQNPTFVETGVTDQVVETLDTKSLIAFIDRPTPPVEETAPPQVTACGGTSIGGACTFLPVVANLPTGPWLSFGSR